MTTCTVLFVPTSFLQNETILMSQLQNSLLAWSALEISPSSEVAQIGFCFVKKRGYSDGARGAP